MIEKEMAFNTEGQLVHIFYFSLLNHFQCVIEASLAMLAQKHPPNPALPDHLPYKEIFDLGIGKFRLHSALSGFHLGKIEDSLLLILLSDPFLQDS